MTNSEIIGGAIRPVECVKQGFQLIKKDYWTLFAVWLVGAIIGGITMYVLMGAMICGIYLVFLRTIDGHEARFDDLWKGMQWFGSGLAIIAVIVVPMIVVYGMIYVPILAVALIGQNLSQEELMMLIVGAIALDFIFILAMVCFHTLLIFSIPLIVDRGLGAIDSMKTSAKAVFRNLGGVAGLIGLNFLLCLAGYLALCIGVYFVIPVLLASQVVAYRQIFPRAGEPIPYSPEAGSYI
jgi:hypothetical protein